MELAGKRILVTGGAGFLGSFVVERLHSLGARTFVPRSRDYDLTQAGATAELFDAVKPELVIHLAARVGGIGANRDNPGRFFYENMTMGLNVIEAARRHRTDRLVLVGTTCSYPKHAAVPFREEDLWSGYPEETNAPYGVAKRALITMMQSYRQQYGLDGVAVIPANLYGPGDDFDLQTGHVIPALIRKFVEAKDLDEAAVELWGTGRVSRDFLYVEDAADGIVLAAGNLEGSDPINLGTGEEITIRDLAGMIREIVGFRGGIRWNTTMPDGQPRRRLDVSKARQRLEFVARMPLREGLQRTVEWFVRVHRTGAPSHTSLMRE